MRTDLQTTAQSSEPTCEKKTSNDNATSTSSDEPLQVPDCPNQPSDNSLMYVQKLANKNLSFQISWFSKFPWLHYCPSRNAAFCFHCMKALSLNLMGLVNKSEDSFQKTGFKNWKKALERFNNHQNSASHAHAISQLQQRTAPSIPTQLIAEKKKQQQAARVGLTKIFSTIQFLARQGLALRGHSSQEGNFTQLLNLRANDVRELKNLLENDTSFTSPEIQNEILSLLSCSIVRDIKEDVNKAGYFSLIVDGTQDVSGLEQESICIRFVDNDLEPHEAFIGLYSANDTTGEGIAAICKDVLLRLGLPLQNLQGQTYDGAANMAGKYRGCSAIILQEQPLATYVHCGAHVVNLVVHHAVSSIPAIRDAVQLVHDLGVLFGRSSTFRKLFIQISQSEVDSPKNIKPLCPTRWLCRVPAIQVVVQQYGSVLTSLEEMSSLTGESAVKAGGLLERFSQGCTILTLHMSLAVLQLLEQLNKSLQSRVCTVSGMLEVIETVVEGLQGIRSNEQFENIFNEAMDFISKYDLTSPSLPRKRQPPARYSGPAQAFNADSIEQHYRIIFYSFVDAAVTELKMRFDKSNPSFEKYLALEAVLLKGQLDRNSIHINQYPELDVKSLEVELPLFRQKYSAANLSQVQKHFKQMTTEVRGLFPSVEKLVRQVNVFCLLSTYSFAIEYDKNNQFSLKILHLHCYFYFLSISFGSGFN